MINDLQYIYDHLKNKHDITLTSMTAFGDRFSNDVPVLYGEREGDRFWVYQEDVIDEDFIFMVEFQKPLPSGGTEVCHTHGHYYRTEQVLWKVDLFMRTPYWYIDAHNRCSNNRPSVKKSSLCGCFYCLSIFSPDEITDWIPDSLGTARCPHCGIDAVLPDSEDYPITEEFLKDMKKVWFDTTIKP